MSFSYSHARPSVAVDCVIFGFDEGDLKVLLIQRGQQPFKDRWALPGGFVGMDESLDEAALRELREETGLRDIFLEQLYTFGQVDRDPRGRVISVAYYALANLDGHNLAPSSDAANAAWFTIPDIPRLAFDHDEILATAITRLQGKVHYQPIGFELLPAKFKLSQLQHLYEVILSRKLDKRNFRKKILKMKILEELDETEKDVSHRAARLYRFDKAKCDALVEQGFSFQI